MMNLTWDYGAGGDIALSARRDFSQVASLFDTANVCASLDEVGAFEGTATGCEIVNVWYIPCRSLIVVYRITTSQRPPQTVVLRFRPSWSDMDTFWQECVERGPLSAPMRIASLDALAWRFPDDPRLSMLPELTAPDRLAAIAGIDDPLSLRILSYLPGKRCTFALGRNDEPPLVVVKMQDGAVRNHAAMSRLWSDTSRSFGMSEPLGRDERLGVRWERFSPGDRLERVAGDNIEEAVGRAMATLVALHRTEVAGLPRRRLDVVFSRVAGRVARRIADAVPALAAEADALTRRLEQRIPELPQGGAVTIHGDFHTANVLFDGTRPILIDLDDMAVGDAAYDLALFGSRILLTGLLRPAELDAMARLAEALPEFYRRAGGCRIPPELYAWYMPTLLIGRQVKTCIRHCAPSLDERSARLLDWTRAILDRGEFTAADIA